MHVTNKKSKMVAYKIFCMFNRNLENYTIIFKLGN